MTVPPDRLFVPQEVLNDVCPKILDLTEQFAQHYTMPQVMACYWFVLGYIIAQCGGIVPEDKRVVDIDSFRTGYEHGCSTMRFDA